MKATILKGDTVMIRRGKERGKRGTVKAVQARHRDGRRRQHRQASHQAARAAAVGNMGGAMQTGGIIEKEARAAALGAAVRLREMQGADAPAPRPHGRRRRASHLRALRRARPRIGEGSVRRGRAFERDLSSSRFARSCRSASAIRTSTRFRSWRRSSST